MSELEIVKKDIQLNVHNIKAMLQQEPAVFEIVRFDSNNSCNLRCAYCHNHRSKETVETADLSAFIAGNVISLERFQVGCIMEPTLDARLCDILLMVGNSPVRPSIDFIVQTNGTLLHRHDYQKMNDAGITQLSLSIDSADPETTKILRGGTDLVQVKNNIEAFRRACPSVEVSFITTVTSVNIDGMASLIELGLANGIKQFVFREIFYVPDNNMVNHDLMPKLVLTDDQFPQFRESLQATYGNRARLIFAGNRELLLRGQKMKADSLR